MRAARKVLALCLLAALLGGVVSPIASAAGQSQASTRSSGQQNEKAGAKDCKPPKQGTLSRISRSNADTPAGALCAKPVVDVGGVIGTVTDPIGAVGDAIGGAAKDVIEGAASSVMDKMTEWWGKQVSATVTWVTKSLVKANSPQVKGPKAGWFKKQYGQMMLLAGALSVGVVVASLISGMLRADLGSVGRTALVNWPIAFFAMGVALGLTQLGLNLVDALNHSLLAGFNDDIGKIGKWIATGLSGDATDPVTPVGGAVLVLIFGLLAVLAALMIFVELLIRDALVYLVLLTLPLGIIVSIWPAAMSVARKMAVLLLVVIITPFFILLFYGFGATMIANGTTDDVTRVLAGVVVMMLAAATPVILLRILPFDEVANAFQRPSVPMAAQMQGMNMAARHLGGGNSGPGGGAEAASGPSATEGGPSGPGSDGGGGGEGRGAPDTGGGGASETPATSGATGGGEAAAGAGEGAAAGSAAAGPVGAAAVGAGMAAQRVASQVQPAAAGATSGAGTSSGLGEPDSSSVGGVPPHLQARQAGGRAGAGGAPSGPTQGPAATGGAPSGGAPSAAA